MTGSTPSADAPLVDTAGCREAYRDLLEAASAVADRHPAPPPGEWDANQILAHVALITAATITAACSVAGGSITTYDNRHASDRWTIDRMVSLVGGHAGLRRRIEHQADALCAIVADLSEPELATSIPALLVSNGSLLVDAPVPLRGLIDGLVGNELPGHASQLRALLST